MSGGSADFTPAAADDSFARIVADVDEALREAKRTGDLTEVNLLMFLLHGMIESLDATVATTPVEEFPLDPHQMRTTLVSLLDRLNATGNDVESEIIRQQLEGGGR